MNNIFENSRGLIITNYDEGIFADRFYGERFLQFNLPGDRIQLTEEEVQEIYISLGRWLADPKRKGGEKRNGNSY